MHNRECHIQCQGLSIEVTTRLEQQTSIKEEVFAFFSLRRSSSDKIKLLDDINLSINSGERVGLVGKNGSGKTTLLKAIASVYPPSSGTINHTGTVTPIIEMGLGFSDNLSGRENILMHFIISGQIANFNKDIEEKIIEFSGLGEKIDSPFKHYSTGMKARLAFSVSINQTSDILLIDEAFSVGDQDFLEKSKEYVKDTISRSKITVLVSHSEETVRSICNRCILMDRGRITMDGSADEVFGRYHEILER